MIEKNGYQKAHQRIALLQTQLSEFRQSTYKTVHDDIGSIVSTASIKAKMLSDQIVNEVDKHHLQEIHQLIKETVHQVALLNKKLKTTWVPHGSDTFFSSIEKDFADFERTYPIQITLKVENAKEMKKQSLSHLGLMRESTQLVIKDALARLADHLQVRVIVSNDKIQWQFMDDAPLQPTMDFFQAWIKIIDPSTWKIDKSTTLITFNNKDHS